MILFVVLRRAVTAEGITRAQLGDLQPGRIAGRWPDRAGVTTPAYRRADRPLGHSRVDRARRPLPVRQHDVATGGEHKAMYRGARSVARGSSCRAVGPDRPRDSGRRDRARSAHGLGGLCRATVSRLTAAQQRSNNRRNDGNAAGELSRTTRAHQQETTPEPLPQPQVSRTVPALFLSVALSPVLFQM